MSTSKKPTRSHHAATFEQKPHAAKAEETSTVVASVEDEPIMGEPVDFDVVGSLKNFGAEVAKIVETLPPNLPPAETTIADHFDCACGPKRNLSMEAGVYRCHGCGTTHHAQTLEGRKAAGK